uniref:Tetraspanin n=1 Tax=Meloidogyne floridensis TaxID=298350 RepID=A0A915PE93_9BILA
MASVPSDINLIINKLSTIDKEKDNEINENIGKESGNDKENIIEESGGYSLIGHDNNKYYVQLYNKFWPYRGLKFINWLIFLLLAVGSILTAVKNLRWAKNFWPSFPPYDDIDIGGLVGVGQLVLAVIGLIALIVHCFAKDLFKAAVASLMDMCFFIFSVVILVISTIVFSLKTISLYRWLRPKLVNFNYTIEAYADITEIDMKKHKAWGLEGYTLEMIEDHKKEIIINVLTNPIMTVLTAITLILNIYLIFCLYKKMRNAKLWNDGVEDYLALFPKCSQIELKYARLGKTKMFQWVM